MRSVKRFIYKQIDKLFLGGCSSYNSLQVRKSCRSKLQARESFKKNNIPHSQGVIFFNPWTAYRFAQEHGFPLVIKPNVGGFSRGSHFPITTYGQLWKAAFGVKLWWPFSVVEKYVEGANYRVTAANGKIMSVIQRYPPFVDGDGHSSISRLIDKENAIRRKMNLFPVIHPIPKDGRITAFLRKKNLTLASVPKAKERVTLFNRIALAPGGVIRTIDKDTIPIENKELFLKVLNSFQARILGIDAIFEKGIEKSYRSQKCIFLEVNSRPYLKMHDFPRYGKREDLSDFYKELDKNKASDSDIF
ncbi:MAG TPA: cyanophycin synthetase [Desulfobulbaceae bacterium]|nr:cyanophycin synthetase [Desulfobulbaceae bacterium]